MVARIGSSRWIGLAALAAAMVLGSAACGGSGDGDGASSAGGGAGGGTEEGQRNLGGGDDALEALDTGGTAAELAPQPAPGGIGSIGQIDLTQSDSVFGSPKVIKNGRVELEVERGEFQNGVNEVIDLAGRLGGTVKSTAIDDSGARRGNVVVRIPSSRFEDALTQLKDIGNIESEYVDTQDVTDEFVDLQSRIRNARTAERVLVNLMADATTIGDTIKVQNQLERVQENIERMRGRLRVLNDQTSFSTLSVDVVEAGVAPPSEERAGTIAKAWDDAVEGFMGVIAAIIVASGVILPVAIMALIVALLVRRLWPRFERETPPPAAEA
ncbi:MAG: DUF4349 domain-containing protein [Actinomycetota bacterium]|nr:DUF4349 domain-containing protein [Actinomycetota bacterium]